MNAPVRKPAAALAAMLLLAATPGAAEQESPYLIKERHIPPEYKTTAEFLDYLKPAKEAVGGFNANVAPRWDIDRLLSYISGSGLTISDLNRNNGRPRAVTPKEIRSAVASRKGPTFSTLAHLGHIYAQPYKQYSELRFQPLADGRVALHMADWYQITFARQTEALKVTRIDYLMREAH